MKNIPSRMRRALNDHVVTITSSVRKVKEANEGKAYAQAAFDGGDRQFFKSKEEIRRFYDEQAADARTRGEAALEAMLKQMREGMDMGLSVNVATASEVAPAMGLLRDDGALIRFVSDGVRRDSYTVVSAAAQHVGADGKRSHAAVGIGYRLDDYEHALGEITRKAEKFIGKALRGDSICADGWAEWVSDAIDASEGAYEALQAAVSGEPVEMDIMTQIRDYMERGGE